MKTWLVLDCNYLSWRAYHSTGHLRDSLGPTGVVYGFFRAVAELQQRFATYRTVFCFDHGRSKRYDLCPTYKKKRADDPEKQRQRKIVHKQIERLKTRYLKRIGYKNVFYADGYEADDVIARVVADMDYRHEAVVVSADKDLYQLLTTPKIRVYNPQTQRLHDMESFRTAYGVCASRWGDVKLLAGCSTDGVPGIPGVADKTAIKDLTVGTSGKVSETITAHLADKKWLRRQRKLVCLPFPGCPKFKPVKDVKDPAAYARVMDSLGFKSLKGVV